MKPHEWWMPEAQQAAFRAVLDGFARPGTVVRTPTDGADAVVMFLSAVLDESVSLADPSGLISADVRRLLLAPAAPMAQARFVLLDGHRTLEGDSQPSLGTLESPELGATLVLTVDALNDEAATPHGPGLNLRLRGPGVPGSRRLAVAGLDRRWLERRAAWVDAFPLGVDIVLAAPRALVALPRTTRLDIESDEEA